MRIKISLSLIEQKTRSDEVRKIRKEERKKEKKEGRKERKTSTLHFFLTWIGNKQKAKILGQEFRRATTRTTSNDFRTWRWNEIRLIRLCSRCVTPTSIQAYIQCYMCACGSSQRHGCARHKYNSLLVPSPIRFERMISIDISPLRGKIFSRKMMYKTMMMNEKEKKTKREIHNKTIRRTRLITYLRYPCYSARCVYMLIWKLDS